MTDSFHDDSDIAPVDEFASNGGDWTKGSDQEDDTASSPSDWGAPTFPSNDASRVTASTRTAAQSKPSVPTYSSKDDIDKFKAPKKDGDDAGSTKHKQPSRRSSGHQFSSSSNHDDRLRSATMPYNSRSTHSSRPYRRNDDRDATLGEVLTLVRAFAADFNEQKETIARLEKELKELKEIAYQQQDAQDELKRICQAWDGQDDHYSAEGEAPHSDEGSQFADESNAHGAEGSSDTAYDASRDVSHAPADEQPPVRDAETPDQEMTAFEDDHKSVKALHDDEREPSRKRQRVDGANDQQNGTQANNWVPRYSSQPIFPPHRKNHHPYNNAFNNQRGGFRGRGCRSFGYQNQGHHAPANVGPYPQGNFGNHANFRQPQRPKQQFTPHNNGPAFVPHSQNNGPFKAPQLPPVQRRNSTFTPNPNPAFIPNPNYVPAEDMGYGSPQGSSPQMNFDGPSQIRGIKRPFQSDIPQYGGDEFVQQPPPPPRPQWQQGTNTHGIFQQRPLRRQPHPGQPHPQQQPRIPILARIGN